MIGNGIGVFALHAGVAGVAQSIWSVASLMGMSSMGPVFITVIGQCMGAGDIPQAEYYFKKLLKISVVGSIVWNGVIFVLTPILMHFYALEPEVKHMVILLVLLHNIFSATAFPFAEPLGKGLRAQAMCMDWTVREIILWIWFKRGKWKTFQVI